MGCRLATGRYVLGVLYGENRPKSENWATLGTLDKKLSLSGPWTTTRSKQYIYAVHPVTCSLLWVRYLFDRFSISDFGGKWPLKWNVSKMSFRIPRRHTELRFVTKFGENWPLQSCRKVVGLPHKKTRTSQDSSQPPFCPKWADRAQNFLNLVTHWQVHVYRIWFESAALCRTYSGKIDVSAQKVITIIYRLSAYD